MANFCLPKISTEKFLQALKNGTINPDKMIDMTSSERRDFFSKIVGEDHAREVNALFESKLLLKDQKRGLVSWAKKVSGISEAVRTDLLSKIERMDKVLTAHDEEAFLEDLAAKKLGTDVTFEEAQHITEGVKAVQDAKEKIDPEAPDGSAERVEYGLKYEEFRQYVAELKSSNAKPTFKEWITSPGKVFNTIAGTTKSILASFDNSYFGRQGIKTLYTNPDIWAKAFVKSWGDIGKEIMGVDAMKALKADIYSRKNALNDKYNRMGLDIGINSEEAFPSTLPERIPILGRLYKASEAAFNGAALRMRADLADRILEKAEHFGINTLDAKEVGPIGDLVNSLTGRGKTTIFSPKGAEITNNVFFSVKFLKSNFDTLTLHTFSTIENPATRAFVRRQAALNLVKIVAATGGLLFAANAIHPGSAELDPRSSNFGKIKVGKSKFDITGGLGSIVTLGAKLVTSSSKSSTTGKVTPLNSGKFGAQTGKDVVADFLTGKLSPIAGVVRDMFLTGDDFNGDKIGLNGGSILIEGKNVLLPLPLQTFEQLQSTDSANSLALMILDGLGFSVSTPTPPKKK